MTAPPPQKSRLAERLGTYLLGVAIGLLLLGFYWVQRQQALRGPIARPEAAPTAPAPAQSPAPTPAPGN